MGATYREWESRHPGLSQCAVLPTLLLPLLLPDELEPELPPPEDEPTLPLLPLLEGFDDPAPLLPACFSFHIICP